jgi:hypothetical protein
MTVLQRSAPAAVPIRRAVESATSATSAKSAILLRRLDAVLDGPSPATLAALRASVTDLVDRLKADGLSRDQVVQTVVALARDHAARDAVVHLAERRSAAWNGAAIEASLPTWCIRAYCDDGWW